MTRAELAQELRRLQALPNTNREEMKRWYEHARAFERRVTRDRADVVGLEEHIWHYLADADIRLKEPAYAKMAEEGIDEIIAELERPDSPASDG